MSDHHELAPSSLPARSKCPCFVPGKSSEAADQGTDEHRLLSGALTGTIETDNEAVLWAKDVILDLCGDNETTIECPLSYTNDDFDEVTCGTADVVCQLPDAVMVIDYKSGEIRDYRAQLVCYAAAAMSATGKPVARCVELYGRYQKEIVYEVTYEVAKAETDAIIASCRNPEKQPCSCDYCNWCGSLETCPEIVGRVTHVATSNKWELSKFEGYLTDPVQASRALGLARRVKKWAESVEESVKEHMLQGNPVPGFQIGQRSGDREIVDVIGAYNKSGIPQSKFVKLCKVSVTSLEKAYGEQHGLKGKELKKQFDETMQDCIVRGKPITTIKEV